MHILHILTDSNVGGAGSWLCYLVGASAHKHSVIIPQGAAIKPRLEKTVAKVYEMRGIADRSFSPLAVGRLTRLIRQIAPDAVHTHASVSARIAARRAKVPCVMTRHCSDMPPAWHALLPKKWLSRSVCAAIATDEKAKTALLASSIDEKKITVVRNGALPLREVCAEEQDTMRRTLGIPDGAFVAGMFARLEAVKDHATVLEAARLCEGKGVYFLVVGTGSLEARLKENTPPTVRFCGFAGDIAPYMALCQANVNASRGTETSNLAIIEGMSVGVVPVVSDYGSNPVLAKDCGLVFETGNATSLADALLRLKNEQSLADALSTAARAAFSREYSAERFARQIDEIYENALRFHKCKMQSAKCKVKEKSG